MAPTGLNRARAAAAAKAAAVLLALGAGAGAQAESPPVDPWTEPAWQDVLWGLPRAQVRRVHATEQLFDPQSASGGVTSTRDAQFEFEPPSGRVMQARLRQERRGEAGSARSLRYVYDGAQLRRVDEDGAAVPALTLRHDAAGRPLERRERTGAVTAVTTWRYDGAGRLIERVADSGAGSRVRETREYRADGSLKRVQQSSGALLGKTVEYDTQERPVQVKVSDAFSRHETVITYPSATESVQVTQGFALGRNPGRFDYTDRFRVRLPQELRGVEQPELPTLRSQERDGRRSQTQTEYDASGRITVEQQVDAAGTVACTGRIAYHPSGPPLSVRHESARPGVPCSVSGFDMDNEIRTDERGQWVEQRLTMVRPDGQRRLLSVHTRRIEYAN